MIRDRLAGSADFEKQTRLSAWPNPVYSRVLMNRILLLCIPFLPWPVLRAEPVTKPNVIFMMADDMGMGDTSAYQDFTGNADDVQLHTPNMERLARMGMRFTDAHTPSSRCSPTRYGLLTGRYPWRNRLKHWVLFGAQGDPMIERDRPTLATLFRDSGYGTAITGKWHVGLRFRRTDGSPAAGWEDADLTQPLFDTPVDHGFEVARYTSRSHGTSGPDGKKKNGPNQSVGPGHIHGRLAVGATGNGKEIVSEGPDAYLLDELGGRLSNAAIEYLGTHVENGENAAKPFFLYYPSPSNHSPYTPDDEIDGKPSAGASRTKSGQPMDPRHDYINENDLILGRFLDWLERNDDPRNPGKKMIETTIVVFTSDNGAEKDSDIATGPFRSNKGSTYEGGHRVPFLVAGECVGIGTGQTSPAPICLTDMFATFAEIIGTELPDLAEGEKGAEDSFSVLGAWRGEAMNDRPPMFSHDHKQAKDDPAVSALRVDSPKVGERKFPGQWKIFYDATLLRGGKVNPIELYELSSDQVEEVNRISEPGLEPLVNHLNELAILHRNSGGHRIADMVSGESIEFRLTESNTDFTDGVVSSESDGVNVRIELSEGEPHFNPRGLGVDGGNVGQVDSGETLLLSFDRDVVVEDLEIVAGNGRAGGYYQVGSDAPLAVYCIDDDIDAKDQSGVLSDIGVLKKGETLTVSSAPLYGSEAPGQWRLRSVSVRATQ